MSDILSNCITALYLFLCYKYVLKPAYRHLFQVGWKSLYKKYGTSVPISRLPSTLIRLGRNEYRATVEANVTGVCLQRIKWGDPITLYIPYSQIKIAEQPLKARLFLFDEYVFFEVDEVELWIKQGNGQPILDRLAQWHTF